MPKEPQSYGSEADWTTGRTGMEVNDQDAKPAPEHQEFYDEKRESERNGSEQGGLVSEVQMADSAQPGGEAASTTSSEPRVSTHPGGAKRDSFFKNRDWD